MVTQYVQKSKDITDLIISFKGVDIESGIKSVHWDIEFRENNSIIASDVVPVDMIPLVSFQTIIFLYCYLRRYY